MNAALWCKQTTVNKICNTLRNCFTYFQQESMFCKINPQISTTLLMLARLSAVFSVSDFADITAPSLPCDKSIKSHTHIESSQCALCLQVSVKMPLANPNKNLILLCALKIPLNATFE